MSSPLLTGEPERAWSHFRAFLEHRSLVDRQRTWPVVAMGAAAAAPLDAVSPEGRSDLVREVMSELGPTTMSPVWLGLAEAELADTREDWEALLGLLQGSPVRCTSSVRPAPTGRAPRRRLGTAAD